MDAVDSSFFSSSARQEYNAVKSQLWSAIDSHINLSDCEIYRQVKVTTSTQLWHVHTVPLLDLSFHFPGPSPYSSHIFLIQFFITASFWQCFILFQLYSLLSAHFHPSFLPFPFPPKFFPSIPCHHAHYLLLIYWLPLIDSISSVS